MLPRILQNFNLYVDGRGFVGRCDELELPKLTLKTEEHRAGGMDAPIEIDMGMEKLEGKITLADYDPDVIGLFGTYGIGITARGSIRRQNEVSESPVVVKLTGMLKEIDKGTWKAGDKATLSIAFSASSYSEEVSGREVVRIDIENMVRVIDGVDQLASRRANLGL